LEVHYREYTPNTPENRILRTALERLMHVPRLGESLRGRLRRIDGQLASAPPLRHGEPIPKWRPTRLNLAYQPALHLAGLVLNHFGLSLQVGKEKVASFVLNMPQVFEDFVGQAIKQALQHEPGRVETQHREWFDEEHALRERPDVALIRGDGVAAVWDAKYKLTEDTDHGRVPDLYQMLAYCVTLKLTDGHLVYVHDGAAASEDTDKIAGTPSETILHVRGTDPEIRIHLHRLDVTQEPDQLLAQMKDIAQAAAAKAPVPA
jgi:5-methylcytosine-specific restriction enzyme subunit McrC